MTITMMDQKITMMDQNIMLAVEKVYLPRGGISNIDVNNVQVRTGARCMKVFLLHLKRTLI